MAASTKETTTVDGNIDLGFSTKKKKFSVGGDTSKIVEFDPSDLGVANRLSKAMPKFKEITDRWEKINESAEDVAKTENKDDALTSTEEFSKQFDDLENEIRGIIDDVFDGEVADKLLGNSSSFSPVNGKFKYEHIIEAMLKCYEQQIQDEAPKFNARKVQKYTNKYIRK